MYGGQPLVTTGCGYLPIGALPTGYLPIGALPTGGAGGGGSLRGRSAAAAALSMAKDATVAVRIFIIIIPLCLNRISPAEPVRCPLMCPARYSPLRFYQCPSRNDRTTRKLPRAALPPALWRKGHRQNRRRGLTCTRYQSRGVQMNKLFFASAALVALGLGTPAAFAADMRVAPAPAPLPVYTNWSGCYVGASAGTSSGRSDGFVTSGGSVALGQGPGGTNAVLAGYPLSQSFNLSGFIGGGTLGCNWQAGAWVFGIEGDGSATNKSGQAFPAVISLGGMP